MNEGIICPECPKETTWERNPYRPFCSKRCKLIDLGSWIDERYTIPEEKGNLSSHKKELKA
ncbi:MAG: DNA gyrase inhibitor YacG [Thermodesulfobacteriota bacterium]